MPLISVIVPVYNVEPYLHRCIDSILNQTFTDFELILVDDGSPDNCGAICDEYVVKDSRIHVIHQENGGLSAARNAGIDWSFANSDSQWLTFIDSDDWVHPEYLNLLYNAVIDNNAKVSSCDFVRVDRIKEFCAINSPRVEFIDVNHFYINSYAGFISACRKLYHKSCFECIRYPIGKLNEDTFVTYKILFQYERIPYVNEQMYYYFANPNSITRSEFNIMQYDAIEGLEEMCAFFKKRKQYDLVKYTKSVMTYYNVWRSIDAREAGVYSQIPTKYRVGKLKTLKIVYDDLGRDKYEAMMVKYYPNIIKLQAYYFKLKSIFKK